jgi:hypothetical protein
MRRKTILSMLLSFVRHYDIEHQDNEMHVYPTLSFDYLKAFSRETTTYRVLYKKKSYYLRSLSYMIPFNVFIHL